jgi:DNA-binding CsgD family transcriptional regulator
MSSQRSSGRSAGAEPVARPEQHEAEDEDYTSYVQRVAEPWTEREAPVPAAQRSRAGWTVLQEYERDGFCYQVLRRPVDGDVPRLTKREAEVLARACQGESNKSIAIELGLSPSTVGVLLFRAAGKLGAQSRQELLTAYAKLIKRSQ